MYAWERYCRDRTEDHNLSSLNDWFIANKLNVNTVKSEFMMFAGSHHLTDPNLRPTLYAGGSQLKPVSCTQHLGVEIGNRLSWSNHIDKICKKVCQFKYSEYAV